MPRNTRMSEQELKRLELSSTQKRDLLVVLRASLREVFEIEEAGELQLSMLVDALREPLAKVYYNKGVADARHFMQERLDDVASIQL